MDWPVGVTDFYNVTSYGPTAIKFKNEFVTRNDCLKQYMDSVIWWKKNCGDKDSSHFGLNEVVCS